MHLMYHTFFYLFHEKKRQKEIDDIIYLPDKFNDFSEAERKKTTEFRQLIFLI